MPRLLFLAACEQTIVDLNNTISLMKLIEEITVQVPADITPSPNAGSPMQWTIMALFEREPGDQNKKFEQYTAFISSSGDIFFQSPITVIELKTPKHRIITQVNGMPVGRVGTHRVRCFIREKGSTVWAECGSYPITVQWAKTPMAAAN